MLLQIFRRAALGSVVLALAFVFACVLPAYAGTTGSIAGTVTDTNNKALSGVVVTATAPSGTLSATTDARGFYNIPNLLPDTYTVSFARSGYQAQPVAGVVVYADQTFTVNSTMQASLRTIASVRARSASNLVQPGQTADVYNLSSTQFQAAQGGDNLHKTLYQYLQSVPGVTILGAGGVPRIRGGNSTGVNYELDGVPINDRLTGLFTTNLSNLGVNSVELYTGGYNARYGHAAQGVINSTIKTGTYPGFTTASVGFTSPNYNHALTIEHGGATPDGRFTYYVGFDGVNSANAYANGHTFPNVALFGDDYFAPDVYTRDMIANFHYKPSNRDDIQLLVQNGYGRFSFDYLLTGPYQPMQIIPCQGVVVGPGYTVTNGGTSVSGQPCVVGGTPTGLQFVPVSPYDADNYLHYSGIGKFQWNHNFNENLFGSFRLVENFNQYIFQQPYDTPNWGSALNNTNGAWGASGIYDLGPPITTGTPALGGGNDLGAEDFYGDRRSNIWVGSYDLTWTPNATTQVYGGVSYEYDRDMQAYYDREGEYNPFGSAFNADGSWPFNTLLVDYPLTLPSFYGGMKKTMGKWTVEPGLRYEHEDYHIPYKQTLPLINGVPGHTGGSYGLSAWEPRLALAYAVDPNTVLRGSYTITSSFVPAAYMFNNSPNGTNTYSGRIENPYDPRTSTIYPEIDNNADLSIEHAFNDGRTSLRISPYYHQARNTLSFYKNYTIVNGVVSTHGPSLLKTDGVNKNFGIELGLNHLEQGTNALSWFLSGTYENSWSSSQTLTTAVTNFSNLSAFLLNHTLYHPAGNPPLTMSFTADVKRDRWHVDPYVLWQCCAWYNVFGSDVPTKWPGGILDTKPHQAPGYWWTQLSVAYDLGPQKNFRLGVLVQNLNNILRGPIPGKNGCYNSANPVCAAGGVSDNFLEQYAPGELPNTQWVNYPDTQQPRSVEVFLTVRQ